MRNYLISIFIAFFLFGCTTQQENELGKNKGLPGKSIATFSPYLYDDITQDLDRWVKKELSCNDYKVINTETVSTEGEIYMDGKGRLFSGIISEKWLISSCGIEVNIGVVFQPDGKGGNYVAIVKLP